MFGHSVLVIILANAMRGRDLSTFSGNFKQTKKKERKEWKERKMLTSTKVQGYLCFWHPFVMMTVVENWQENRPLKNARLGALYHLWWSGRWEFWHNWQTNWVPVLCASQPVLKVFTETYLARPSVNPTANYRGIKMSLECSNLIPETWK